MARIAPRLVVHALALFAISAAACADVHAQSVRTDRLTMSDYLDWVQIADAQISPDGKQVAYVRRHVDRMADRWQSEIWTMNIDGSSNRRLTHGSSPVWSPDGKRIAYLAVSETSGVQMFVQAMDTVSAPIQITEGAHAPGRASWSPDGRFISFTMLVPDVAADNPFASVTLPGRPEAAKWTDDPRVITRARWQWDRIGYLDGHDHIFVVPAGGGPARQLTQGGWDHAEPEWSPDSREILFSSNRNDAHEYQRKHSEIYSIDVATARVRQLTHRQGPDADAVVSPDGRLIAYVGDDWAEKPYSNPYIYSNLHIYVMNRDGSGTREISGDFDRGIGMDPTVPRGSELMWSRDGKGLYFNVQSEGSVNLYYVSLNGGVTPVTRGTHKLVTTSMSANGRVVGIMTSFHQPEDVVTFTLDRPQNLHRITASNDELLERRKLGAVEEIWYKSLGDLNIQGWIVKPPDFDPARKYPLILAIHGGPESMYGVGFNFAWQEQAANGFVVLYTNPRGSTGYGSKFVNEIMDAYPGNDYHDLMTGVDTLVARGYIDANNLFVYGGSGGGVLTAWVVGHTTRFAAASANFPITNWISWVGTADVASSRQDRVSALGFAKPFWEDPSEYLRRSPLMYVHHVKTPTLLMTGVRDLRTPMNQTEEFYQALKAVKVPTVMVRFNNEWHGTSSTPSNFMRTQLYMRKWFDKWRKPREHEPYQAN